MSDCETNHLLKNISEQNTESLLQRIVESAVEMRDTEDLTLGIQIIKDYKELLLENGIFLKQLLDIYEDTIHT